MGQARLDYGLFYPLYNRGNNRGPIFTEERNYYYFLDLMWKYLLPILDLYAYCLLPNHFHLLIRVKDLEDIKSGSDSALNLSIPLSSCFGTYTKGFNKSNSRTGKLFEGRFKRNLILCDQQLFQTIKYIHHNPQNHGLVKDFRIWPYSSYWNYINRNSGGLIYEGLLCDRDFYISVMSVTEELYVIEGESEDA